MNNSRVNKSVVIKYFREAGKEEVSRDAKASKECLCFEPL